MPWGYENKKPENTGGRNARYKSQSGKKSDREII